MLDGRQTARNKTQERSGGYPIAHRKLVMGGPRCLSSNEEYGRPFVVAPASRFGDIRVILIASACVVVKAGKHLAGVHAEL